MGMLHFVGICTKNVNISILSILSAADEQTSNVWYCEIKNVKYKIIMFG